MSLIKDRKANANTLTAASILASIYIGNPGSALVITMMSTISERLSEYTSEKTKEYIHSIMELDTSYAWKVNEQGIEEKVELSQVQVGDTIVVFTGEKIPVDGIVIKDMESSMNLLLQVNICQRRLGKPTGVWG